MTSYIHPQSVQLSNTEYAKENIISLWMNSPKRGDYCALCTCDEENKRIDCRKRDLVIVPMFISGDWNPRILDLRENPRLVVLGTGSLDGMELHEIRLPSNIKYISQETIVNQPELSIITWEEKSVNNVITHPNAFFSDVCCGLGESIKLQSNNLTFCNMQVYTPGCDSVFEPFWEYKDPETFLTIKSDAEFMAEAAEDPNKCAEYCTFTEECNYFSYKALWMNAEHTCNLLKTNGTPSYVCCKQDDYGDEEMTVPGWVSGRPPRTRNYVDNARVVITQHLLDLDDSNGYKAQYQIKLGSTPLRGAVWITPTVASDTNLEVNVSPISAVLYDDTMIATITVQISNTDAISTTETIVLLNDIDSCDTAFTKSNILSETTMYLEVKHDVSTSTSSLIAAIIVPLSVVCIIAGVYLYTNHKKRLADSVWSIQVEELKFDEPPEIIGRGTFGLVLLAEYRGTPVAVKRVLPPRDGKKSLKESTTLSDHMHLSTKFNSGSSFDFLSSQDATFDITSSTGTHNTDPGRSSFEIVKKRAQKRSSSILGRVSFLNESGVMNHQRDTYAQLKADFIKEMRHLSKLRHPCITVSFNGCFVGFILTFYLDCYG